MRNVFQHKIDKPVFYFLIFSCIRVTYSERIAIIRQKRSVCILLEAAIHTIFHFLPNSLKQLMKFWSAEIWKWAILSHFTCNFAYQNFIFYGGGGGENEEWWIKLITMSTDPPPNVKILVSAFNWQVEWNFLT